MYPYLLFFHSVFRWLVLAGLLLAIYRGLRGSFKKLPFTKADDSIRHITATIAHVQLSIGYVLYFNSPLVTYFRQHYQQAVKQFNFLFFGLIHIALMTVAVIVITIGSSVAKRRENDIDKFNTMCLWFIIALIIIFIAIPWPFSPLAQRPLLPTF